MFIKDVLHQCNINDMYGGESLFCSVSASFALRARVGAGTAQSPIINIFIYILSLNLHIFYL